MHFVLLQYFSLASTYILQGTGLFSGLNFHAVLSLVVCRKDACYDVCMTVYTRFWPKRFPNDGAASTTNSSE